MDAHTPTECMHRGEGWGLSAADRLKQTSKAILKLYTPKSSICEFLKSYTLVSTLCCPSLNFNHSHRYVVVCYCNINLYFPDGYTDIEHHFIFISQSDPFFVMSVQDFCSFLYRSFLPVSKNSSIILDTILSSIYITGIFSHSVAWLLFSYWLSWKFSFSVFSNLSPSLRLIFFLCPI